ncbi:MAG: arginine deiminase-related protein [Planctomycetes bacterium]|nr:arginine deiminase-related protein [Planctomycetota bacterium]
MRPVAPAGRGNLLAPEGSNPTTLDVPAYLLDFPFSYGADVVNNSWMEDLDEKKRRIDMRRATRQFLELYNFLSSEGVVYLLPSPDNGLQDLVFTANLGVVLDHLPEKNTVVLSNFTVASRRGETEVGKRFFEAMGYRAIVAPDRFEGEAELKHLHDNVYLGGYGLRSSREVYDWMERTFDMRIVRLNQRDPYLYHLDTTIFPITRESTLVCTELFDRKEVAQIEKVTNILDVSADHCFSGITNCVRLYNTILNASHLHDLKAGSEEYREELSKNRRLEDLASEMGFEVTFVNLSEYLKAGAVLSCMVMHLNRASYDFRLL